MIRKAELHDIDPLMTVTKACAKHMIEQGIFQWNEHYPSRSAFENDVRRGELFVFEQNNSVVGSIVLSDHMDEEYIPIKWLTPNGKNLYIHRLAIHPIFQGKGYARLLMEFGENYATENNYSSVRLDTFSQNKRNQKFYELRNYKRLGNIYFPKQSEYPFYCYELVL